MAVQVSKSTILGWLGTTNEGILNQVSNILESIYFKAEGKIVETITEVDDKVTITFSDDSSKTVYNADFVDTLIASINANPVDGWVFVKTKTQLEALMGDATKGYYILKDDADDAHNGSWGFDGTDFYQGFDVAGAVEEEASARAAADLLKLDKTQATGNANREFSIGTDGVVTVIDGDGSVLNKQNERILADKLVAFNASKDVFETATFKENNLVFQGSLANFPINNKIFIPTQKVTNSGYIKKFSVPLTNAQSGRTVRFYVLEKINTNDFKIKYVSDAISAELDGINELVISDNLSVEVDDYLGCSVFTSNTDNSLEFINGSGGSPSNYGGWNFTNPSTTIDDSFTASAELVSRGFQITADVEFNTVINKFLPLSEISDTSKSIKNLEVNKLEIIGSISNYGISSRMLIPSKNIQNDGFLYSFSVYLNNAQSGRTVRFVVLEKDGGNNFKSIFFTDYILAETADVFYYNLAKYFVIKQGQFIGAEVVSSNTSNSIQIIISNAGNIDDYGGWIMGNNFNYDGTFNSGSVEMQSRGYLVDAIVTGDNFVKPNKNNVENGFLGLDSELKIPENIYEKKNDKAGLNMLCLGTSFLRQNVGVGKGYIKQIGEKTGLIMRNNGVSSSYITDRGNLSLSRTVANGSTASYETLLLGITGSEIPKYLYLSHMINDINNFGTGVLAGNVDSTDKTTLYGAYNFIIAEALSEYPKIKIVIDTPPNIFTTTGNLTRANMEAAVVIMDNLCKKWNLPFLNFGKDCGLNETNYALYKTNVDVGNGDLLHPSYELCRNWGTYLSYNIINRLN